MAPSPERNPQLEPHLPRPRIRGIGQRALAKLRDSSGRAEVTGNPKHEAEFRLKQNFKQTIGALSFSELAIIDPRRNTSKPPKSLNQFRFIPMLGNPRMFDSLGRSGYVRNLPKDLRCTFEFGQPYLDAYFGIGIARHDWLVALSSAGIDNQGNLKVVQLQDMTGLQSDPLRPDNKDRFKSGLYDGFLWRNTLVTAWIATAVHQDIGDKLTLQSGLNNHWSLTNNEETLVKSYDAVAEQLGFTQMPDKNWSIDLQADNFVWPDFPDPS